MRGLIAIVLCAGCYSPSITAGTPCETDCPGDLVCIDHVCRDASWTGEIDAGPGSDSQLPTDAMVDAADGPPGDADADTVPDGTDNCPSKANPDQHDEDADVIGDVCDPCPHLAGNVTDGDGDGVGDLCDPQPTVAKQRIKFFDPFTSDKAEWTHETGAARLGETLRIDAGSISSSVSVGTSEARIEMAGTVAAIANAGGQHQVAVYVGKANLSSSTYHYTEFYDSGGSGGEVSITKANSGTFTNLAGGSYTGTLPTGAWAMRIEQSVATQRIGFGAVLGGTPYGPYMGNTSAAPAMAAGNIIEIFVRNVDLRLDYFIVIETMP